MCDAKEPTRDEPLDLRELLAVGIPMDHAMRLAVALLSMPGKSQEEQWAYVRRDLIGPAH